MKNPNNDGFGPCNQTMQGVKVHGDRRKCQSAHTIAILCGFSVNQHTGAFAAMLPSISLKCRLSGDWHSAFAAAYAPGQLFQELGLHWQRKRQAKFHR
jgi:hypothetical protein